MTQTTPTGNKKPERRLRKRPPSPPLRGIAPSPLAQRSEARHGGEAARIRRGAPHNALCATRPPGTTSATAAGSKCASPAKTPRPSTSGWNTWRRATRPSAQDPHPRAGRPRGVGATRLFASGCCRLRPCPTVRIQPGSEAESQTQPDSASHAYFSPLDSLDRGADQCPGGESRTEPSCTIGAARQIPRLQKMLKVAMLLKPAYFTTVVIPLHRSVLH